MSKKHYTAIANILAANKIDVTTCRQLAAAFASDNPNFDITRFLIACGFRPGTSCPWRRACGEESV